MNKVKRFALAATAVLGLTGGLMVMPTVSNPLEHTHDGVGGPVASAQAHEMYLGCHHKTAQSPSLSLWEEDYVRATTVSVVGGGKYHYHVYYHANILFPWQNHYDSDLCGKYNSSGTLVHYW